MIRAKIASKILFFFDYFQQKKIYIFLKKKIKNNCILIDVGAHHGETIKNFKKYFNTSEIHSFEASGINFKVLNNKYSNQIDHKIFLNNFGLSNEKKIHKIKQLQESSSTTISRINENSKYFKKKMRILGTEKSEYFKEIEINLETFDNYCSLKKLNKIDLLKIDTEGHEMCILKGCKKTLKFINFIYFEHHYDDMLDKGYTFSDINNFLKNNGFKKIYKSKMYFRKTFEYVYQNSNHK
jgi:FkbM family methyltransferase